MEYRELKKYTKDWSIHDLCDFIYPTNDQEDNTFGFIDEIFAELNSYKIQNEYGALYSGDLFMFIDGHIEYLYSIYHMLPREELLFARDARFNFYQAHYSQVFNALNHFMSLLLKDEGHRQDIYFFKNIDEAIDKYSEKRGTDNGVFAEFLKEHIKSPNYQFLWLIRNSFVHKYVMPLEPIDMAFILRYAISYSLTIFLYFKYIDDEDGNYDEAFIKWLKSETLKFKDIQESFNDFFKETYLDK